MSEKKLKTSRHSNNRGYLLPLILFLPLGVYAEENTNMFLDMSLEELSEVSIVSLFNESILEANSSATVIHEDEWQANGARRMNEIMAYQPSSVSYSFLGGSNVFAIRGYASRSSARGVATLLDGVPMNTYSFGTAQYFMSNFDLGALQRVEMIRGPGSAIYGSDAFHGVFSLSTFDSEEDVVEAESGIGSTEYRRGHIRTSQQINDRNRINLAVASTHKGEDSIGFNAPLTSDVGVRKDEYTSETAIVKSTHELGNNLSARLGLYLNRWNAEDFPSFGEIDLGSNDISDGDHSFYMINASAEYKINSNTDVELKTFAWETRQQFDYLFDPVPFQFQHDRRTGVSLLLKNRQHNGLRWVAGVGYDKAEVISAKTLNATQAFDGLDQSIRNIFTEVRIPLNERETFIDIAGRIDDYSGFGSQVTPRLSLIHKLAYSEVLKFVYGNAFRAPVASEITSSGVIQGNEDLTPEIIDNYELVWIKHKNHHSFSATAFYNEWEDAIIIVDDPDLPGGFTQRYENQGERKSMGYELEFDVVYKQFRFESAYTYTQSEDINTDQKFKAFPKHILQLAIDCQLSNGVKLRLYNIVYHDTYDKPAPERVDETPQVKLDTIWSTNLHVSYAVDEQLSFALDVRDILNRQDDVPSLWRNAGGLPVSEPQISAYLRFSF